MQQKEIAIAEHLEGWTDMRSVMVRNWRMLAIRVECRPGTKEDKEESTTKARRERVRSKHFFVFIC